MTTETIREAEHAKYRAAYRQPKYRMSGARMEDAVRDLADLPCRGSYLDVGCGRGEMLRHALQLGYLPAHGAEVVDDLIDGVTVVRGEAHALPFTDAAFDVVSLFDVIEHLPVGDDELACQELRRVARRFVLLTANNRPSKLKTGEDLHINIRPYPEWDERFRAWFAGCEVTWLKGRQYISEGWRVALP